MENKKVFFARHYPSKIAVRQELVTGADGLQHKEVCVVE